MTNINLRVLIQEYVTDRFSISNLLVGESGCERICDWTIIHPEHVLGKLRHLGMQLSCQHRLLLSMYDVV